MLRRDLHQHHLPPQQHLPGHRQGRQVRRGAADEEDQRRPVRGQTVQADQDVLVS